MALTETTFDANASGSKGAPALHTYETADSWATIEGAGYFTGLYTVLKDGDMIFIHSTNTAAGGQRTYQVRRETTTKVIQISQNGSPVYITSHITDVSTAGQIWIASPIEGRVTKVVSVLQGAIATADATLTVKDKDGNSMGTITIANSSSAAGDVDTLTPSAENFVEENDGIEIETDGGSTNTIEVKLIVEITPTIQ